MGRVREDLELRDRRFVFENRGEAGRVLADELEDYEGSDAWVLAIPSGGVPVGLEVSERLDCRFDLILVRKIHLPWNPEVGFGSVTWSGEVFYNESLLQRLSLSQEEIDQQVEAEKREIDRRMREFRGGEPFPVLEDEVVILVDDGMASGFSMLAAVESAKRDNPERLVVAVPTGSENSVQRISEEVDELVCLNIRTGRRFAVAEAYRDWHDLEDEDVLELLKRSSRYQASIKSED